MSSSRVQRVVLAVVYLLIGAFYAIVTPIGEAPDEAAHLAYVDHVLQRRAMPEAPLRYGIDNYEWHQPPLDYIVSSMIVRVMGVERIQPSFVANPGFDFRQRGSRAFITPSGPIVNHIRALRVVRLGWGLVTLLACFAIVSVPAFAPATRWLIAAYLFAPQFLFISAVITNDTSVIAFSSLALLLLIRFMEKPATARGLGIGVCLLSAVFAKASGLFLVAPIIVAAAGAIKDGGHPVRSAHPARSRTVAILGLLGSSAAATLLWALFNWNRFGSVIPTVPSAGPALSPVHLVSEPRWLGSLIQSFWAKFGWLNTPMPAPFYAWFGVLSVAVVFGAVVVVRRVETRPVGIVLVSALLANAALLIIFLVQVDRQPQGRYLFPSIAAIATCGMAGLDAALRRSGDKAKVVVAVIAVAVAVAGVITIVQAYA